MTLPTPSTDALIHQQRLLRFLDKMIQNKGSITFAEFMAICLYAPGLGYYSAGAQKFGEKGDFVTAPIISPLFSQTLAKQCAHILSSLSNEAIILELGAGNGIMAKDVIKKLSQLKQLPAKYYILEVSADLRQRQQTLLQHECKDYFQNIVWLDKLPQTPFEGIILANEVIDAMPVDIFKISDSSTILEAHVTHEPDWQIQYLPAREPLRVAVEALQNALGYQFPPGYTSEINLGLSAWIKSLSAILSKGIMLLIDYGFSRHEYYHPSRHMGTLMCHYRHHAHSDPLRYIGLQDITAHVDFTHVAQSALDAHLEVRGYTTQGAFLLALGILENSHVDAKVQFTLSQQIQKLTSPHEMGELFKVMALAKNMDEPLQGFSLRDFRHRL